MIYTVFIVRKICETRILFGEKSLKIINQILQLSYIHLEMESIFFFIKPASFAIQGGPQKRNGTLPVIKIYRVFLKKGNRSSKVCYFANTHIHILNRR